ncbi:glycosyltransferase family 4 protein [Alphaproteobacteria bacterium]|jgi:glycosyltransferase involved in cell wall biosynthesis|nr:glycosyltransferase family 4 protein [Alphaproteobacteria bacterium]
MKVAFYAPLKSPNHPTPSGDRTLARLLISCLTDFCDEVNLVSEFRSLEKSGNEVAQEEIIQAAAQEAARILDEFRSTGTAPDAWFTYHLYYKAPDLIGPTVSKALGIPYVAAEASRAPKRAKGAWQKFHTKAEEAIDHASVIFHLTKRDLECLEQVKPAKQKLVYLPPFIDVEANKQPKRQKSRPIRLVTIAMMRNGDKLASYQILAESLSKLASPDWTLDVIGDGEASDEVRRLFQPCSSKVKFHGLIDDVSQKTHILEGSDIFVWPGINEAFGFVYLEAQAAGLPVVALKTAGVPEVVAHGQTGLLAGEKDLSDYAQQLDRLICDEELRSALAINATEKVRKHHSKPRAIQILKASLESLVS